MIDTNLYEQKHISNWTEIIDWYETNTKPSEKWLFRGLRDSKYGFESSLERAYDGLGLDPAKYPLKDIEAGLIRRFKRQSHHYLNLVPETDNILEWLSLMQHYGAPTRLLDWTHSLFVALFFAVEQANNECAIWAIEHEWITSTSEKLLSKEGLKNFKKDRNIQDKETFETIFSTKNPKPFVLPVKPYKLNERLVIQQGTFLCPGDISKPFEENLTNVLKQSVKSNKFIKIVINDDPRLRQEILKNLNRMNMNAATLYPGLAGFAQSLRTMMIQPEILKP